jgi:hypothetical protein
MHFSKLKWRQTCEKLVTCKISRFVETLTLILKSVGLTSQLNHPDETPRSPASTSQPSLTPPPPLLCFEEEQPWRASYSQEEAEQRNIQTNQQLPIPNPKLHFQAVDNLQKAKQLAFI